MSIWSNALKIKGSKRAIKGDLRRRRRAAGELYDDMTNAAKKTGSAKPAGTREQFIADKKNWKLPGVSASIGKIHTHNETPEDDNANPDAFTVGYRGGDRDWAVNAVYANFKEHATTKRGRETTSFPTSYAGEGRYNHSERPIVTTTRVLPKTSKGFMSVPIYGSKKGNDNAVEKAYQQGVAAKKAKKASVSKRKATRGKGGRMRSK